MKRREKEEGKKRTGLKTLFPQWIAGVLSSEKEGAEEREVDSSVEDVSTLQAFGFGKTKIVGVEVRKWKREVLREDLGKGKEEEGLVRKG